MTIKSLHMTSHFMAIAMFVLLAQHIKYFEIKGQKFDLENEGQDQICLRRSNCIFDSILAIIIFRILAIRKHMCMFSHT